ncbi:prepilin-type N-terminal cleavage/methylation domain-containing protein [Pseudoalteromonas sp. S4498]|uniref:type IV pilin protein n=1 Tax=Pseudoalteromonas galatheae TaxID=579562 RepID=UPI001109D8E0|nr:type IV pilin protein [Pseudoalteromonas galatheae]NKC17302.1 prepilin-type N-terminal cleavage/methylation domain-containing protein [Pseudoalteromonas galatheae]
MSVNKGFTLTELLIAVAIVAITASVAYPSYVEYVQDARRSQAQQNMLEMAGVIERIYSRNSGYPDANLLPNLPQSDFYTFKYTPTDKPNGAVGQYRNLGYQLTATPITGKAQAMDRCGVLSINHLGEQGPKNNDCWQ